ncbi:MULTISPECIES: YcaO-like family protein [Rhodococcus]|uniref:YcaO-like family protein n=1 Tax=Nocardiaceae TaxID=85025 RepID=UPI000686C290|nr:MULTISPECIES: YcaO-like family protein [Rhodococcus]MDJ0409443.1 YcaO-like family protein [Rhodococcus fascians]
MADCKEKEDMYDALVDPRFGVLTRLDPRSIPEHFPSSFALTHSRISDISRFSDWPADNSGAGYGFGSPDRVLGAAIGEGVERYCGNLVPDGLRRGSYLSLTAEGVDALDPATVCLYSAEQHAAPRFPASELTGSLDVEWIDGTDLSTGSSVWVPASLVWPSYFGSHTRPVGEDRPLTNPIIQAGLAAGPSSEFACWGALCEILERDAMTLSWYGGRGVHEVSVPTWLRQFARGPQGRLDTRFYSFTTEFGIPVLGSLVHDRSTGFLTLGMGVGTDAVRAAEKAYAEALQLQLFVSEYDDPTSAYMQAAQSPTSPLKPWREDRAYGMSYRSDRRDLVDYVCHLQIHLDPEVQEQFRRELTAATLGSVDLSGLDTADAAPTTDRIAALVKVLNSAGHRVVEVDVTTADVRAAGLHVVRVVATGLYSSSPIGLPFLGGSRMPAAVAAAAAAGTTLPTTPLPH